MSAPTGDMFFAAGIVTILAIICAMEQLDYFMLLPGAFAGFLSLFRPEVGLIMGKIYPPLNEPPEDS